MAIAKFFRGNLGLPQHGRDDAATPLFLFGEAMLDLLVCHGTAFALESGLEGHQPVCDFPATELARIDCCFGAGADSGFGRKAND